MDYEYECDECGARFPKWNAAHHHEWMFHEWRRTTRLVLLEPEPVLDNRPEMT